MLSDETVPVAGDKEEAEVYSSHWDGVYLTRPEQLHREWHCNHQTVQDRMRSFVWQALRDRTAGANQQAETENAHMPSQEPLLVDVGCGGSDMASGIRDAMASEGCGRMRLILLDISSVIIESMAARYKSDSTVNCVVADCRSLPVSDSAADVVLDKGTLDALYGDADKMDMMQECCRILACTGVMISISFGAVGRLGFLENACKKLKLQHRTFVIGEGDPMAGHQVVFLTVMAKQHAEQQDLSKIGGEIDDLTRTVLDRIKATGSMYDDQTEADATAFSVFDD